MKYKTTFCRIPTKPIINTSEYQQLSNISFFGYTAILNKIKDCKTFISNFDNTIKISDDNLETLNSSVKHFLFSRETGIDQNNDKSVFLTDKYKSIIRNFSFRNLDNERSKNELLNILNRIKEELNQLHGKQEAFEKNPFLF